MRRGREGPERRDLLEDTEIAGVNSNIVSTREQCGQYEYRSQTGLGRCAWSGRERSHPSSSNRKLNRYSGRAWTRFDWSTGKRMTSIASTVLAASAAGKFAGHVIPALAERGATVRGLVKDEVEG
jgi:hypothetical protein